MVFSSIPLYLDHHHHPNWHQLQHPNHHQQTGGENPQLQTPPPPSQVGGSPSGSIRPGSMVDRARIANLPLPEAGLKCPRCDSTNTKFCYFNNYSLTQPRHFCKTCRRYWTRGGALRNVPVGGGCRRNKRSKSSSGGSKSADRQTGGGSGNHNNNNNSTSVTSPSSCGGEISGGGGGHFSQPQFPFMSSLQSLNMGSDIQSQMVVASGGGQGEMGGGFHIGLNPGGNNSSHVLSAAGGADQWRLSFLAGFEPPPPASASGLMIPSSYQSESVEAAQSSANVKVEQNNLSRQFLGISENNNQYWSSNNGINSWATGLGFAGLNSSSTNHHLL